MQGLNGPQLLRLKEYIIVKPYYRVRLYAREDSQTLVTRRMCCTGGVVESGALGCKDSGQKSKHKMKQSRKKSHKKNKEMKAPAAQ